MTKTKKTFGEVWCSLTSEQCEYLKDFINKQRQDAVKHYKSEQLRLHGVSKSFKTELEMHEIATEKYQEHNYGDAKYDGFMECYRMLVKETKNKTSLSK
jgi:hypothetical protein